MRVARRNPCILIAVHAAVVEHQAVVLGVKGQSLRSGILLNAIRVYEAYALEVEVLGTCHECSAYVYVQRIVASAQFVVAYRHLVTVLSDEM